jgi:hypothetical protein
MAEGASRATMVELPKQVHLQKDVGAGLGVSAWVRGFLVGFWETYMLLEKGRGNSRKLSEVRSSIVVSTLW